MAAEKGWLGEELARRGVSRRDFVRFCAGVAAYFALPKEAAAEMAEAVEKSLKPSLVWLEFQDCAGNTESLLRASRPTVAEVILDSISLDYHETIMAAAGKQAEDALHKTMRDQSDKYLVVIEGSIPTGANGAYCTIGGKSALQMAREACEHAAGVIAVGTCAAFGGIPAAAPNPTSALGVADAVPGIRNLVNMPACPANVENLTALIVYFLTYKRWPPMDSKHRPLFAYGKTIHDNCERRAHFDAGQYVEAWGDEAHRNGECLFKMGCKGPATYQNCPVVRWNEGTNWPIGCGHPCIGCAEPNFWDAMTPFYRHLSGVPGFGIMSDVDKVGVAAVAGVGAAFAAHGLVQIGIRRRAASAEKKAEETKKAEPAAKEDKS
ncbi:MAG TPA: hydrogenase small subunit [Polyangiaceae bacterium]|nr:hydrogenase small subunit [Polyangiaceae bacterium]